MGREVWLTVTGEQKDADGRRDRNVTQCRALYKTHDGLHEFEYEQRDPESGQVTSSRMIFADSYCRIDRTGAVSTSMLFELQKERSSEYETGFGTIFIKTFTKRLAMRRTGDRFHAGVFYTLILQGGDPMECMVTVKAEPLNEE